MITIIKKPFKIAPASNNNVWVFTSNVGNLQYVIVTIKDGVSNAVITKKKIYPKPNNGYLEMELNDVLKQLGESILINSSSIITGTTLPCYKIEVQEYIKNADVIIPLVAYVPNEIYYFFDASLNDIDFLTYTTNKYNITADINEKNKFLTNTESIESITTTQKIFYKIFNVDGIVCKLKILCYDSDGDFLKDIVTPLPTATCYSLNLSPSIVLNHPSILSDGYENIIGMYKVVIINSADEEISESRIIKLSNTTCKEKETNLIYKNSIGGFDTIRLLNPVETININKSYYNKYLGTNGTFTDDYKMLNSKQLMNLNTTYNYVASTQLLSDYNSKLLKELLISNKVFVLVDKYLVEVTIDTNKYKVLQRNTNGGKKARIEIQFTSPFSIVKLESLVTIDDIEINPNPDSSHYLTASGDFVIDGFLRNIILKY